MDIFLFANVVCWAELKETEHRARLGTEKPSAGRAGPQVI